MINDLYIFDIVPKRKGIISAIEEIKGTREYLEFMMPIIQEAEYYEGLKERRELVPFRRIKSGHYGN